MKFFILITYLGLVGIGAAFVFGNLGVFGGILYIIIAAILGAVLESKLED